MQINRNWMELNRNTSLGQNSSISSGCTNNEHLLSFKKFPTSLIIQKTNEIRSRKAMPQLSCLDLPRKRSLHFQFSIFNCKAAVAIIEVSGTAEGRTLLDILYSRGTRPTTHLK